MELTIATRAIRNQVFQGQSPTTCSPSCDHIQAQPSKRRGDDVGMDPAWLEPTPCDSLGV